MPQHHNRSVIEYTIDSSTTQCNYYHMIEHTRVPDIFVEDEKECVCAIVQVSQGTNDLFQGVADRDIGTRPQYTPHWLQNNKSSQHLVVAVW